MTRHGLLLISALLLCMLLTSCAMPIAQTTNPLAIASATLVPDTNPVMPVLRDNDTLHSRDNATLYFRFGTEPYLAPESRTIMQTASQSYEYALLNQLLAGPGTQNTELHGLFPDGVRVLSTVKQGRTLFVTLSGEIMNLYPDEPIDWQEFDQWRIEAPLRRRLCMQALVATVTENCDVDQVQILVQQSANEVGSLRLKQNYFLDDSEDSVLVGPMTRDASLLLTAEATLNVVLNCWRSQDWQRLYLYMSADSLPFASFVPAMNSRRLIVDWSMGPASISADGAVATFAVDFTLLTADGQMIRSEGRIVRLQRENGLWKTSLSQLTAWQEEAR